MFHVRLLQKSLFQQALPMEPQHITSKISASLVIPHNLPQIACHSNVNFRRRPPPESSLAVLSNEIISLSLRGIPGGPRISIGSSRPRAKFAPSSLLAGNKSARYFPGRSRQAAFVSKANKSNADGVLFAGSLLGGLRGRLSFFRRFVDRENK